MSATTSKMKPNISFLRKVADGRVYPYAGYSAVRGRTEGFVGGQVTAERHEKGGFVKIVGPAPHVMMKGSVTLTAAGRAALILATT